MKSTLPSLLPALAALLTLTAPLPAADDPYFSWESNPCVGALQPLPHFPC